MFYNLVHRVDLNKQYVGLSRGFVIERIHCKSSCANKSRCACGCSSLFTRHIFARTFKRLCDDRREVNETSPEKRKRYFKQAKHRRLIAVKLTANIDISDTGGNSDNSFRKLQIKQDECRHEKTSLVGVLGFSLISFIESGCLCRSLLNRKQSRRFGADKSR